MDESHIPIDIHTGKLLDWLVSRRHVKKDWQKGVLPIREKINAAIQDMPAHEGIARLLAGAHINYFHCLKIVEILKETEADSKNLFGRYGSQRMKDWQEIAKLYERDNTYLGESASLLVRNVNYEVPGLKKQAAKFEQLQNDCDKKIADYAKKEATSRGEFTAVCKQIGIAGDKIKSELIEKLKELPELYDKIGKQMSGLKPALELYTSFTKCIVNEQHSRTCLPMLKYMAEHGNTTVYEWSYGEAPLQIEPDQIIIDLNVGEDNNPDQIDFGDPTEQSIDFGSIAIESEGIDFGNPNTDEINWGDINYDEPGVKDDMLIGNENVALEESGIVIEDSGNMGGIAKGKDALSLLDNPSTRTTIIDQLIELEAFLKMRLYEISTDSPFSAFSSLQDLPIESADSITSVLDLVQVTVGELTEKKINHLHNIKHSPRYVDTLSAQLKQKLVICDKMNQQIEIVKEKKREAHAQAKALVPILDLVIKRTKELQHDIEVEISKKYNGRPVNLMGGIKAL